VRFDRKLRIGKWKLKKKCRERERERENENRGKGRSVDPVFASFYDHIDRVKAWSRLSGNIILCSIFDIFAWLESLLNTSIISSRALQSHWTRSHETAMKSDCNGAGMEWRPGGRFHQTFSFGGVKRIFQQQRRPRASPRVWKRCNKPKENMTKRFCPSIWHPRVRASFGVRLCRLPPA